MKKLMMAVAIVCATVAANAATFDWDATGYFYWSDENATGLEMANATIYLFQGGSTEMGEMLTALGTTGESALTGYLGSGTVSDGTLTDPALFSFHNETAAKQIADDGGTPKAYINAYLIAVTEDGKFATGYAYPAIEVTDSVTGSGAFIMPDWTVDELPAEGAAGWATVAPEPTSGLLLLIGVAGLALRRRRA